MSIRIAMPLAAALSLALVALATVSVAGEPGLVDRDQAAAAVAETREDAAAPDWADRLTWMPSYFGFRPYNSPCSRDTDRHNRLVRWS